MLSLLNIQYHTSRLIQRAKRVRLGRREDILHETGPAESLGRESGELPRIALLPDEVGESLIDLFPNSRNIASLPSEYSSSFPFLPVQKQSLA